MNAQPHAPGPLTPEDERFLDEVLDRAIDLLQAGKPASAHELVKDRSHLMRYVEAQLEAARALVPRAAGGMPTIKGYALLREVGRC